MSERVVHAACPHDCPDTCAMLVTVDGSGRATRRGRRRRASGDGRLPLRQGLQLPRSRLRRGSGARAAGPRRRQGRRALPRGRLGRGLGPGRRAAEGRDRRARRGDRPPLQLPGHDGLPAARFDERARLQRARGERPGAHDLRRRRQVRGDGDAGRLARGRSGALAQRALHPVLGLEPDVDRPAPVAPDPRRAAGGSQARGHRSVPQPDGAHGRRAPAATAGHRRGAGAGDDARDRRRGAARRAVVPRPHDGLRRSARAPGRLPRRALRRGLRRTRRGDRPRGPRVRLHAAVAAAARRRRAAPQGRPDRLSHDRLPARARRLLAPRGRRMLLHPDRHRRGDRLRPAPPSRPPPGTGAPDQHVPDRARADRHGS